MERKVLTRKVLTRKEYASVLSVLRSYPMSRPSVHVQQLQMDFPHFYKKTLQSIHDVDYTNKMKKNTVQLKSESIFMRKIFMPFQKCLTEGDINALLRISDQVDVSPALVSKRVLEQLYLTHDPKLSPSNLPSTPAVGTSDLPSTPPIATSDLPSTPAVATSELPSTPAITTSDMPSTPAVATSDLPSNPAIATSDLPSNPAIATSDLPSNPDVATSDLPTPAKGFTNLPSTLAKDASDLPSIRLSSTTKLTQDKSNVAVMTKEVAEGGCISSLYLLNLCLLRSEIAANWSLSVAGPPHRPLYTTHLSVTHPRGHLNFEETGFSKRSSKQGVALKALITLLPMVKDAQLKGIVALHINAQSDQPDSSTSIPQHSVNADSEPQIGLSTDPVAGEQREGQQREGEQKEGAVLEPPVIGKKGISEMLKRPHLIADPLVSANVEVCLANDDQYGPIGMALRSSMGCEYEQILLQHVQRCNLQFKDEKALQKYGYDKTPDIKLDVPVAVDGQIINWIESKALFGDEITHRRYLSEQLWSYWNRFGPGMVIYWFGYILELENLSDGILLAHSFPRNLHTMDHS